MASSSSTTFSATWDTRLNLIDYQEPWGVPGAFTTMRLDVFPMGRVVYFKDEHIERLFESLNLLGVQVPFARDWIVNEIETLSQLPAEKGQYLFRLMATADCFSMQASLMPEPEMHLIGHAWVHERVMPEAKSLNYEAILAELGEIDRSQEELLLQSSDGRLLEGATTNLLFVKGRKIIVPRSDNLNGITLKLVVDLMKNDYEIIDDNVHALSVNEYEEILCCGTGKGVAAIMEIPELEWQSQSLHTFGNARVRYESALIDCKYR